MKETGILRETLETPIAGHYDVIVCGGGPAGSYAAIAAARAGAKTLLIERMNSLGGMSTSGYVNPLFDQEEKGGLTREIVNCLAKRQAWGGFRHISFRYEDMKSLLETKYLEAGGHLLYNTTFARALTEGNRVVGVVTENVSGRQAHMGKVIIDATGDAYVAASAGAAWDMGDENGHVQAMTLMFLVANIPEKYNTTEGLMMRGILEDAYAKEGKGGKVPFAFPVLIPIPGTRLACVQLTHMYDKDPLDARDITAAVVEGRRQMLEVFNLLKTYDPDFAETDLVNAAPLLGVRESRRIRGEYTMTVEDLLCGRTFPDAVASSAFNIDIHHADDDSQHTVDVPRYEIPYRALIPVGLEGLLVAGRCISGTHEAQASYRVTGDCSEMGEAAGLAAAEAALRGVGVREVDVKRIRGIVTRQ